MSTSHQEAIAARSAFSRALHRAREDAGLSRNQLASRMGYTNLSKGASKIALFERGEALPRGDQRPRLTTALPELSAPLTAALQADEAHQRAEHEAKVREGVWERRAQGEEARLVIGNLTALSALLARPEGELYRRTPLPSSALNLAYIGGRLLTLGELIDAWEKGALMAPCPCHGLPMPVFRVSGSPLSGSHSLRALCTISGEVVSAQHGAETLLAFAKPLLTQGGAKGEYGPCLERALEACGVRAPQILCTDSEGEPVATWRPETRTLHSPTGERVRLLGREDSGAHWRDERGALRHQSRPVLGALSPLRFGAWRGARLVFTPRAHALFYASSGHLRDAKEVTHVRWTRLPPPEVITQLITHLNP